MNHTEGRSLYRYWQSENNMELEKDNWEEFINYYKTQGKKIVIKKYTDDSDSMDLVGD